jgi:hypothetical protein
MPSPFPGMDPYLESRVHFEGFHNIFIVFLTGELNATLPREFVARVGERLYVLEPSQAVPDVTIFQWRAGNGNTAVLTRPEVQTDAPLLVYSAPEQMRESFIEIVPARQEGRIITAIELLSPANKENGRGREEYVAKQGELLHSDTHLIEIDLLRGGTHTIAASRPDVIRRHNGLWDYLICLHRANAGYQYETWPRTVRDVLPHILVPLTENYPDVSLDLQSALTRAYDEGAFDRMIDYSANPTPPLAESDAAWADALLRSAGLRG